MNGKLKFAIDMEKRTREFAVRMIRLSSKLPNTPEGKVIRTQITKSGSSMGANYIEANRSRSKPDFKNRIEICESEASETQFWLQIIIDLNWLTKEQNEPEYPECRGCWRFLRQSERKYNGKTDFETVCIIAIK